MRHLQLLTSSSAKTFRRCAREYRFRYVEGWSSTSDSAALAFGTVIHLALEAWWLAIRDGLGGDEAVTRALGALSGAPIDEPAARRARCMIALYHARWFDETSAEYEVLAVEQEFRSALVNPDSGSASRTFQRAGKIDALVRHRSSDRVLVVEHKTSSEDVSPGSAYWDKLTLDNQVSTYIDGARALGFERIDGCLYDVLAKPRHDILLATPVDERKYTKEKRDKAGNITEPSRLYSAQRERDETIDEYEARVLEALCAEPERYVRRGVIVRLEEDARDAAFDDWQTARAIRDNELAGRWPRNTDNCFRFNRKCQFFPVCTRQASLDSDLYRKEAPHRELTAEPEQQQQQQQQEIQS